jgi:hypothetical protein
MVCCGDALVLVFTAAWSETSIWVASTKLQPEILGKTWSQCSLKKERMLHASPPTILAEGSINDSTSELQCRHFCHGAR